MTYKILWAIPFAAALTACGGTDDTTGTTTAAAQIATTGVSLASTGTFPTGNSPMTLVQDGKVSFVNNEVINVKVNPLSATASSNRKDFTFDAEIYGKTVTMTWNATEGYYSGRVDGKDIYLKPKETGSDGGSWVASYDRLEIKGRNSSYTVWSVPLFYGFETPDAVVAAATGTANYSGSGSMVYLAPNAWEISGLQANFAVDFNTSTISGAIKVDDPYISGQQQPANTYTFATISVPTTALTGNGFSAQPTVTVLNPGTNTYTFSNQTINGSFYGDSSDVLAGTLSTDYTVNGTAGVAVGNYWAR